MKHIDIKKLSLLFIFVLVLYNLHASKVKIEKVEPAFWWAGMENPELQLMIYGENISLARASVNYKGVTVSNVIMVENPNYLFVNLKVSKAAQAGKFNIIFEYAKNKKLSYEYELKARTSERLGIDNSDVMYLIMPDRFANGDVRNDNVDGMKDKQNRKDDYGRHGGDIAGIINHLDYLEELGVTALWLNPVQENNMTGMSYHGYAITDFYNVDPRLGSNQLYRSMVDACHTKGMKVVMDMVFNHAGSEHWWMKDLPMKSWLNQFPEFTRSNFTAATISDPYASDFDQKVMQNGWFSEGMPDLNQSNPLVEKYLIQNSIWWIEYAGLDGIRMDTYPYPKKNMMTRWVEAVHKEYPGFFIVGEAWVGHVAWEAYWAGGAKNDDSYDSKLPSVTDFPLHGAIEKAFKTEGNIKNLYEVLSMDFMYQKPCKNVIFVDNHDLSRFYTTVGENTDKFKLGLTFLLTTRGIPQIYYGTEVLHKGDKWANGDGVVRKEFEGGWPGDKRNTFVKTGRKEKENEVFDYLQKLLKYRKSNQLLHSGQLKHFIPDDQLYVYFRYDQKDAVMIMLNNKDKDLEVDMKRYNEMLSKYKTGKDIISGSEITDLKKISIKGNTAMIIELK